MSSPLIKAEVINLNGQLKLRLITEKDGKVVDVDELNVGNAQARCKYVDRVAAIVNCNQDDLAKLVLEKSTEAMDAATEAATPTCEPEDRRITALNETPQDIQDEADAMLRSQTLFERIATDVRALGVASEERLAQRLYVVATSRFLTKPLASCLLGASSGGKSFIVNVIASMMPDEAVVHAHDFTSQSFYYMAAGSLRHKFVVSGEREREHPNHDRAEFGSKAFREMTADGKLKKCVPVKRSDGRLHTEMITQDGPIAYVETSTAGTIHDEDRTRMLVFTINEGQEQTEAVLKMIQEELAGRRSSKSERKRIQQIHQTVQRLLDPEIQVQIPWADMLSLPSGKIAARRTMKDVGGFIQTIAFLRQRQKRVYESDGRKIVLADETDYRLFLVLMRSALSDVFESIDELTRNTLSSIERKFVHESFTRTDLAATLGIFESHASRRVKPLVSRGLVARKTTCRPHSLTRTELTLDDASELPLPKPEEIGERMAALGGQFEERLAFSSPGATHAEAKCREGKDLGVH